MSVKKLQPDALLKYLAFSYSLCFFSGPMFVLPFPATRYKATQNIDWGMKRILKAKTIDRV